MQESGAGGQGPARLCMEAVAMLFCSWLIFGAGFGESLSALGVRLAPTTPHEAVPCLMGAFGHVLRLQDGPSALVMGRLHFPRNDRKGAVETCREPRKQSFHMVF